MAREPYLRISFTIVAVGSALSILIAVFGARLDIQTRFIGRHYWAECTRSIFWTRYFDQCVMDVPELAESLILLPTLDFQQRGTHPAVLGAWHSGGNVEIVRSGWPWRSLEGWRASVPVLIEMGEHEMDLEAVAKTGSPPPPLPRTFTATQAPMALSKGILCTIQPREGAPTFLPMRPRWAQLIANAGVFSLLLALLLVAIGTARYRTRIALGLCPHCRYDLRHTPPNSPCPECGTPFSSSRSSATNDKLSTPDASPPR